MKIKSLILCLSLCIPSVFARESIIDNAGLLSPLNKASLLASVDSAASAYNFDLVIVTEKNIGPSSPKEYADNFFDNNGYGTGQNRDGCLFLLVTESRDYYFSTSGRGINILNSAAYNKLESGIVKMLKENDFFGAFRTFLLDWEEFLALDAKGRSYNFFQRWNLVLVIIAWILALAIGFIVVRSWKTAMNTVLPQTQAAAYVVPGSLEFKEKRDSFLYSTVNKIKLQSQSSSLSKGVSAGLSGSRHGGGGGKY